MNLLIVEDDTLLGVLLADALAEVGHHVLGPAASRSEALKIAAASEPDLAIIDIDLAGRDSGIDLARDLRQRGIPCLFATGQPGKARAERELAIGLVPKPYAPMAMIEAIRYFEALQAGQSAARVPPGIEAFATFPATSPMLLAG